jgi:hypothetical protein
MVACARAARSRDNAGEPSEHRNSCNKCHTSYIHHASYTQRTCKREHVLLPVLWRVYTDSVPGDALGTQGMREPDLKPSDRAQDSTRSCMMLLLHLAARCVGSVSESFRHSFDMHAASRCPARVLSKIACMQGLFWRSAPSRELESSGRHGYGSHS